MDELVSTARDALHDSRRSLSKIRSGLFNWASTDVLPPIIENIRCLNGDSRKPGELWAEWDKVWNHAKVDQYSIHVNNNGREYVANTNSMAIGGFAPGEEIVFFVRPLVGKFKGEFKSVGRCTV